jgi:cathepsin E
LGNFLSNPNKTVPTVTDNLYAQRVIKRNEVSLYLQPPSESNIRNGVLTFGGTGPSKIDGDITYV